MSKTVDAVAKHMLVILSRGLFIDPDDLLISLFHDHLIKLEKEYPPWAALHFNQPGRGVCIPFI